MFTTIWNNSSRIRSNLRRQSFAVYAVGESWTGALGSGSIDQDIPGHYDDEDAAASAIKPMYSGPALAVGTGWGHSALVTEGKELLLTGRPHDFAALLRLKRLPKMIRDYSARQTLESTDLHDPSRGNEVQGINVLNPTEMIGSAVTWLSRSLLPNSDEWETARLQSALTKLTPVEAEGGERLNPVVVECSAGFSAFITESGQLYAFGINGYGQCGTGQSANNIWHPTKVTGLSTEFASVPRAEMDQTHPITQVALGLQHGICLNSEGEVFTWGKGERGQLGQERLLMESHAALPIKKACKLSGISDSNKKDGKPVYRMIGKVRQISAGMIHSAALTDDNAVLIWGKHVLPAFGDDLARKVASDAVLPFVLEGLPPALRVEQIACGSHHTAILMEDGSVWAVGVASDSKEPIHQPIMIVPSGIIEMPVRQFAAHMDRTSIVGCSGRTVYQIHLWKDPELQHYALFTPSWIDQLLIQDEQLTIREVHRGWIHSVALTDP